MEDMEKKDSSQKYRIRFLFGCLLIAVTLLLIGASRLGDSMATRQTEQEQARREWTLAAEQLLIPQDRTDREEQELRKLAAGKPELFLEVFHQGLQPVSEQ